MEMGTQGACREVDCSLKETFVSNRKVMGYDYSMTQRRWFICTCLWIEKGQYRFFRIAHLFASMMTIYTWLSEIHRPFLLHDY